MHIIVANQHGPADAMRLESRDTPAPGPTDVRVRVRAAGVNFIDVYHRSGLYPGPAPVSIGLEGAGDVEEVGAEVADLAIGDRVAWTGVRGSYATHIIARPDQLVPLPKGLDYVDGAAAMLQGMTAHYLTASTYPVAAGDTCLVHAAAGGVGRLLCQMIATRGGRAIGTVSTEAKAAVARAAGAADIIRYTETDFESEVMRLTGNRGVAVVYDSVGATTFDKSLRCLAPRGTMVLFGQSSGPVLSFDPQILNQRGSLYLTRPSLFHYIGSRAELLARSGDVLGWVADGSLSLRIDRALPLAEAAEAHRLLEGRQTSGKLVLVTE